MNELHDHALLLIGLAFGCVSVALHIALLVTQRNHHERMRRLYEPCDCCGEIGQHKFSCETRR